MHHERAAQPAFRQQRSTWRRERENNHSMEANSMLKMTLLASAFAALLLAPAAASAGDREGHRGHFVRPPKVVIVLPHRPFVFHHHLRARHPNPEVWHRPAPRHRHVWRGGPPPKAHWRRDRHDHRRWDRDDDRLRHGHEHGSPGRHWQDGTRHFAGSPWQGRRRD
jgi:hypothetical protein